ncbi:MAG TPA: MBL fold metallo-hydrolase [Nocardioidaceae bacterium]|jgi:ribonuclease BN (tRNA processing enzyme)|nr:MBL fold metallo-hydrolase [Nocardioidaceae bacterium]
MRLTIVGCSGSYPGPDSAASCYLVEAPYAGRTWRLVLDLGNGAFGPLQAATDVFDVDAVLISHLHADHCVDLTAYFVARKFHPSGPRRPLSVYGPADIAQRVDRAYGSPGELLKARQFEFHVWGEVAPLRIGPFGIQVARVHHPVETYAISVEHDGRRLVYSGDTGPCDSLVSLAAYADLLLCEASFREGRENPSDLHMTGGQAGDHATRAGARMLVLTHVPPWYDPAGALAEAQLTYDGPLELAKPGATYDI